MSKDVRVAGRKTFQKDEGRHKEGKAMVGLKFTEECFVEIEQYKFSLLGG
jgi:hypothetical protein